ncbi:peroxisomal membrane protein pex14 [Coemansia sp. Benny D115]|nr:peroxisomal membrane protein pex14 [Coemansia sp. Benny D115]
MSATAAAAPALREDIIESAVRFLADPKVQSSTLAKKISFLETKGLTNAEIEDALARAKSSPPPADSDTDAASRAVQPSSAAAPATAAAGYGYAQPMAPPTPPPRPHLDWKDYFIAAVVAGGLGYGLYMFAKKYIKPLLMVRDDNQRLEEEKRLLVEQNELTRKQLQELSESTARILETISRQSQRTGDAIEGMASVMDKITEQEAEQNTASRRLQITLEDLQREIAALAAKSNKAGDSSVADIQSDIRSLRSLLLSRRAPANSPLPAVRSATPSADQSPAVSTTSASAFQPAPAHDAPPALEANGTDSNSSSNSAAASVSPTPTIPAWQLALANGSSDKGKQAE